MEINRFKLAAALALTVPLISCSDDEGSTFIGNGQIEVSLDVDPEVLSASIPEADAPAVPSLTADDFSVTLTAANGSYSKTWERFTDFPLNDVFTIGDYKIEASHGDADAEGFDMPYYYGSAEFSVREAQTSQVQVSCALANSVISVATTEAFAGYFSDYSTTFHSDGGAYFKVAPDESRLLYMKPGEISVSVTVTKPNGQTATFAPQSPINALPRHHYRVKLDVNGGEMGTMKLVLSFDDSTDSEDVEIDLSDDIMSVPSPEIITQGFSNEQIVNLVEGQAPASPLVATISAPGGLKSVMLSCRNADLQQAGIPAELDLMKATSEHQSALNGLGLNVKGLWRNPDKMAIIDFAGLVANLHPDTPGSTVNFSLLAVDAFGKASEPMTLSVVYDEVTMSASAPLPAVLGRPLTTIEVTSAAAIDPSLLSLSVKDGSRWISLPVIEARQATSGKYEVTFNAPEGSTSFPVRILYNGRVKAEMTVGRAAPEYEIHADPFACSVVVKVVHPDPDVVAAITRYADISTTDGSAMCVVRRQPLSGLITVAGLNPSTSYSIKSIAVTDGGYEQKSPSVSFVTESKAGVPNGDFEDAKLSTEYSSVPSGGRYSETHVGIFNHQNYWSYDLYLPTGSWATVNDKTMCRDAKRKNTWYQQLSAQIVGDSKSGSKAMKLTSVAWDADGEPIRDYAQKPGEFVAYNPNVPHIAHRAAGKLFLGSYSYSATDNTETYTEGVSFTSRPSALTGYYKYLPASRLPLDNGVAVVELLNTSGGKETVVAHGVAELPLSADYTSFSVRLSYDTFGLKATTLRIMFSSSANYGTIESETASVVTVDDVVAGASRGGSLWIDNLSFAY